MSNKKFCLKNNNTNSFIEGYLSNYTCPESNVTLNKLSELLLESGIFLKKKNIGLHRLLKIIIQDLKNLVNQAIESFSNTSLKKPILLSIIGGNKIFTEIKDFLLEIIQILEKITSKEDLINLKNDLEDPLIQAIIDHLMIGKDVSTESSTFSGLKKIFISSTLGSNNRSKKYKEAATVLFKELLKHVFIIYVSPWGLQIHEECKDFRGSDEESILLKKSIISIFKFFLSNTILGYFGTIGVKSVFHHLPFENCFNNYILAINKKIKTYRKCQANSCQLKNQTIKKKCIVANLETKQLCKDKKLSGSIIKQAIEGSFIAELFIKSEFNNRKDTSLDMRFLIGDLLHYFIYYSKYSRYIPEKIELPLSWTRFSSYSYKSKDDLKEKILNNLKLFISTYNELNCTLFKLEKTINSYTKFFNDNLIGLNKIGIKINPFPNYDFLKNIIYPHLNNWGISPLCDNLENSNILKNINLKINGYKISGGDNFKGNYTINNNIMHINLVSMNDQTKITSYYYSAEARYYMKTYKYSNIDFPNELIHKISARLNNIRFLYVNYFKKENSDNEYYIKLYPTIKHNNNEYNISVFFNNIREEWIQKSNIKDNEDINNFLKCLIPPKENIKKNNNTFYMIKNDPEIKKKYLEYIKDTLKNKLLVKLEEANVDVNSLEGVNSLELEIQSPLSLATEYVIPKSYLFGNTDLEYIIIKKEFSGGSKKYIRNKVNKKEKSKIIKKK